MTEFWELATTDIKVYFVLGSIGTIVYLLKLIGSFTGADHADMDVDVSMDNDGDIKFFTIQTISLFLMGFGWMGLFLSQSASVELYLALAFSLAFGVLVAGFELWIFWKIRGLEQIAEFDMKECIGKEAIVYLQIPSNGIGEVQISVHGKRKNYKAKTIDDESIQSFSQVIVENIEDSVLIVRKK